MSYEEVLDLPIHIFWEAALGGIGDEKSLRWKYETRNALK
jgi:hypothetical protein